ncbi:cytochrome P450 [Blastococcus sp. PRF04-17]|uniref:cytochrome P450 n=1 Tax=Blastococcus sp. PRF04-17 TaxID=2933797 RepID=UPI001FF6E538|nr:cytochrome P450 [Blastococcus sp. PRF04-17]UOY00094.1 cytochrome P450 [Blastococcus sp. PRF04-17]
MALAERIDADTRAVRHLTGLRERYGAGPVRIRLPGRQVTVVLSPDHVHRVLDGTPRPFSAATREKRAALAHFQPEGLLISSPAERAHRRTFNEAVLDTGSPVHRLAGPVGAVAEEEADALLAGVHRTGRLDWDAFGAAWWRVVRRVVLGEGAREDHALTDDLRRLRRRGNFSLLAPTSRRVRERFLGRLARYVEIGEPGSLAGLVASTPAHPDTVPHQQMPQWLFAFDAMSWAAYRALALLAMHPGDLRRARAELPLSPDLPYTRAALLESLRLWPTTPAILRDTTEETTWESGTLPAGASVLVFAPFFHRDATRLDEAHRFAPELWLRERTADDWPLVPFSAGPGMCPGRNLVLLTASVLLGRLVEQHDWELVRGGLARSRPLPGTLDPFRLRFCARRFAPVRSVAADVAAADGHPGRRAAGRPGWPTAG